MKKSETYSPENTVMEKVTVPLSSDSPYRKVLSSIYKYALGAAGTE